MSANTDVVHRLWVVVVVVTIARSGSFIWLCHFQLLLELTEVLSLRFAEFCKLIT
jgi:hypothetical protein